MICRGALISGLALLFAISPVGAQMFSKNSTLRHPESVTSEPVFALGFSSVNAASGATFSLPTCLAVAPDGRIFVGEKGGRLFVVQNGAKLAQPFIDLGSEILTDGDRGLMGLALDPNFELNGFVYLAYVTDLDSANIHGDGSAGYGRIIRVTASAANPNVADLTTRLILLGRSWSDGVPNPSGMHTIDALRFAPDGTLLVSTGDGDHADYADGGGHDSSSFVPGRFPQDEDIGAFRSQFVNSLAGKILRIDPATGNGLPSNPLFDGNPSHNRSKVWVRGFRNPFRFSIKPGTGTNNPADGSPGDLYVGDCGWKTWEELDVSGGAGGQNFGWPCHEGPEPNPEYALLPASSTWCPIDSSGILTEPLITWNHDEQNLSQPPGYTGWCAIGTLFCAGNSYPSYYRGACFVADFSDWINLVRFNGNGVTVQPFASNLGVPVDMANDPQTGELLYLSIFRGELRRVVYTNPQVVPVAVGSVEPVTGPSPLSASFHSALSFDPLGRPLTFHWDFGDSTSATVPDLAHTYQSSRLYIATLSVACVDTVAPALQFAIAVGSYGTGYDATTLGAPIASRLVPGNPTKAAIDVIHDRTYPPVGNGDSLGEYTTYDGTSPALDYLGYSFQDTLMMSSIIFQVGINSARGGWFTSLGVQVRSGGIWSDVDSLHVSPSYTGNDGSSYRSFVLSFAPRRGDGIRLIGPPGGTQKFVSAGEVRVITRNQSPRMHADASTTSGRRNLTVQFSSAGSSVPDGELINSQWDFGDGGSGTGQQVTHQFTAAGQYRTILKGTDPRGAAGYDTLMITVYPNTSPHASIASPADSSYFQVGGTIFFDASGIDAEQPESTLTFSWEITLHRKDVVHTGWYTHSGRSFSYSTQNDAGGDTSFYEAQLVVSDSGLLADTGRVFIFPNHPPMIITQLWPFRTGAVEDSLYRCTLRVLIVDVGDSLHVVGSSVPSWLSYERIQPDSPYVAWRFSGMPAGSNVVDTLIVLKVADELGASDSISFTLHVAANQMAVSAGWNMVSYPRNSSGVLVKNVFPTSISRAFYYAGGYQISDSLARGIGYWLKFDSSAVVPISGRVVISDTIPVAAGWNIIGSLTINTDISQISSAPPGNLAPFFFGYDNGYLISTELSPGKGYWIKAGAAGDVIVSRPPGSTRGSPKVNQATPVHDLNTLSFRGASGTSRSLYFGNRAVERFGAYSELPPVPPPGAFDVRFASQGSAARIGPDSGSESELPIQLQSSDSLLSVSYSIAEEEGVGYMLVERKNNAVTWREPLKGSGEKAIYGRGARSYSIALNSAPRTFSISQNYPNPFNSTTLIRFHLPVPSLVSVRVFNILGEEVARPVMNRGFGPGDQFVPFDAPGLASGVYFYRLQATGLSPDGTPAGTVNSGTGKMILAK